LYYNNQRRSWQGQRGESSPWQAKCKIGPPFQSTFQSNLKAVSFKQQVVTLTMETMPESGVGTPRDCDICLQTKENAKSGVGQFMWKFLRAVFCTRKSSVKSKKFLIWHWATPSVEQRGICRHIEVTDGKWKVLSWIYQIIRYLLKCYAIYSGMLQVRENALRNVRLWVLRSCAHWVKFME